MRRTFLVITTLLLPALAIAAEPTFVRLPKSGLVLKLSDTWGWRADQIEIAGDKVDALSRTRGPALTILVPSFVENLRCAEWEQSRKAWKRSKLAGLLPKEWLPRAYERKEPTALEACRDVPGGALTVSVLGPVDREDVAPIRDVLVALGEQLDK